MTQLALLHSPPRTLCGYCLGPLAEQADGTWQCERCQPELAAIRTVDEWAAFQRRVRRGHR